MIERAAAHWDWRDANGADANVDALAGVVAAERAFAADSVKRGIRASFLAAFAEDGINFTPHPERTREALLKQDEPPSPEPVELDWHPAWADVSAAGDLGYTTGPYSGRDRTGKRPSGYGYYFSIWKRPAEGPWKVAIDAGIRLPAPPLEPEPWYRPAPGAGRRSASLESSAAAAESAIRAREAELAEALEGRGASALADFAADEARLHRDGAAPHLGRDDLRAALVGHAGPSAIEVMGAGASASGELGYAWGKATGTDASVSYFVRVWRRGSDGRFRVTLDWANALPKPAAP